MQRLVKRGHLFGRRELGGIDAPREEGKLRRVRVNVGVAIAGAGGYVEIHRGRWLRCVGKSVSILHGHSGSNGSEQNAASAKHHFTPCFLFSSEYRITRFMAHACGTDAGVVTATVQAALQHGIGSGTIAVKSQEG